MSEWGNRLRKNDLMNDYLKVKVKIEIKQIETLKRYSIAVNVTYGGGMRKKRKRKERKTK